MTSSLFWVAFGALIGNPRVLLIDEPTEGLAPLIVQELTELFIMMKKNGLALLLAAQNVNFALTIADQIYVIDRGHIVYQSDIATAKIEPKTLTERLAV